MNIVTKQSREVALSESIPVELKERPQWVLWKNVSRNGDVSKRPYSVTGEDAKSNDPETWATFEAVVDAFDPERYAGIGYTFCEDDPFVGVDLDGCRNPVDGSLTPWAQEIINQCDTYTEVSPSQTGVKLFCRSSTQPPKGKNKRLPGEPIDGKTPGVEVYSRGRYFTVTGDLLNGHPYITDCTSQVGNLLEKHWPHVSKAGQVTTQLPAFSDDHVMERARKYVAKMPGAVSGQSGHNQTFAVACKLVQGFDLSQQQALMIMREFSSRCEPPWTESDMCHKVEDADKQPGERGYLLRASHSRREDESDERMVCTFAGVDVAEHWHLIDEPTQWLVNDVFACGQPTIVGAKQKSLKTTLMADLAVCFATGFPWLRKFEVPKQRRILVITGEASLKSALKKIGQAADSLNVKPEQLKGWVRVEAVDFPTLPRQEDCDAVALAIHEYDIDVCILDPLYMGLEGLNTANLTEVGPAMRRFMAACKPAEVIICHHVKKTASFDDAPNLEDLSQAGIAEFAGNYWLMGRMSEYMGDGQHEIAIRTGGRDDQFHLLQMNFNEILWQADFVDLQEHREKRIADRQTKKHEAEA
ncbi:MAG: AAA family ATPase, partial [Fuerstiella sp.]|nr:AAA family ATPase [Fuerstiella sp.]